MIDLSLGKIPTTLDDPRFQALLIKLKFDGKEVGSGLKVGALTGSRTLCSGAAIATKDTTLMPLIAA